MRTIAAVSYIGPKFVNDYIDRKTFTLQRLQKELVEAATQRDIEHRNLERASIKAPVTGTVLERNQTRHQYLTAGTPLLTIGKLDDMEVIAEVLTERAVNIKPGDAVEIFGHALSNGPVTGKVTRVFPSGFKKISSLGVEQQRVNVVIQFDNRPDNLGVGFRVQVRIVYVQAVDAVTLPRTSLFRADSGQWQVMVIKDGTLQTQDVSLGLSNEDCVQVLSGIEKNQQVLAVPANDLKPGMPVKTMADR